MQNVICDCGWIGWFEILDAQLAEATMFQNLPLMAAINEAYTL